MQKINNLIQEIYSCIFKILEENKRIFQYFFIFYKEVLVWKMKV
nr:MAG TPA: hypothetical protein [Caudoviricetes sp.]